MLSYISEIYPSATISQFGNDLHGFAAADVYRLRLREFLEINYRTLEALDSTLFVLAGYYPALKYEAYLLVTNYIKNISASRGDQREIIRSVFRPLISPRAYVASDAVIGLGCVIAPFAYIGPRAALGIGTKCNVRSSVHHESIVGAFCTISPCASLLGSVRLGRLCIVGASATLRNNISVGNRAYVGMHSNVVSSIGGNFLYYGNPARPVKRLEIKK